MHHVSRKKPKSSKLIIFKLRHFSFIQTWWNLLHLCSIPVLPKRRPPHPPKLSTIEHHSHAFVPFKSLKHLLPKGLCSRKCVCTKKKQGMKVNQAVITNTANTVWRRGQRTNKQINDTKIRKHLGKGQTEWRGRTQRAVLLSKERKPKIARMHPDLGPQQKTPLRVVKTKRSTPPPKKKNEKEEGSAFSKLKGNLPRKWNDNQKTTPRKSNNNNSQSFKRK